MHIICLTPLEEGVYNDHASDNISAPPEGWAYIPEDFVKPSTFPRLGSLEAEELPYAYEVEVEKEVIKTREVEVIDEEGCPITVTEEYTETELATEQRTKIMMTVTVMTEGTLPPPTPEPEVVPTVDEKIEMLEVALAESDAVAMALYEETANQSAVNAEQDTAILGLYEMIGG